MEVVESTEYKLIRSKTSLQKLALGLGLRAHVLSSILNESGYSIKGNLSKVYLDDNQLEIIFSTYKKALKDFFANTKKNSKGVSPRLQRFFKLFIVEFDNECGIYGSELNDELIGDFFYRLVKSCDHVNPKTHLKGVSFIIKIRLVQNFKEVSRKIISFFIMYQYSSFSIDDDAERSYPLSFSY